MHVDKLLIELLIMRSNLRFCMLQPISIVFCLFVCLLACFFFFFSFKQHILFLEFPKKAGFSNFLFFIMKTIKLSFFFHFTSSTFLKTQLEIILWHREIDIVAFPLSRIDTHSVQSIQLLSHVRLFVTP